jgi:hypothetical protein
LRLRIDRASASLGEQSTHRIVSPSEAERLSHNQEKKMSSKHPASEHHTTAADEHDQASKHHREAAKNYEEGKHETAAHHAHSASGHASHARDHAEQASRKHTQQHGGKSSGSSR